MSESQDREDRTRLDGFEFEIFKLVRKEATSEQWKEWLRAPLEHAAAKGNTDLFMRLMDAGADGSAGWRGCRGRTLLGAAAHGGSEQMVLALLRAGAKPDLDVKFGAKGESALHVAAAQGAEAVSSALMLAGADPDLRNGRGRCLLHVAAKAGHHVIVKELLLKGADPNAKTWRLKETPLHVAAVGGNALCVSKLLLGGADKDSRNYLGQTPLQLAAVGNHLSAVEELLTAFANVNLRNSLDWSALNAAVREGHEDMVRVLLRHGADSKACLANGATPLHIAAQVEGPIRDNGGIVRSLLEYGANIEAKMPDGGPTPLHHAADGRVASRGTMHALLEGRADVNALCGNGLTALHLACRCSSVAGVELLLQSGADERKTNERGETPSQLVGRWELANNDEGDNNDSEERTTDDQRILLMLESAPADRSWRRRGWLVLCGSYPTKVRLAMKSGGGGSSGRVAMASFDSRRGGDGTGDQTVDVGELVGRVVGLEVDGVFRLVVGFL